MQVTDDMVRAALDAYNEVLSDLSDKADQGRMSLDDIREAGLRAALTAALAHMWRPIEEAEPNRTYILGWSDWRDDKWITEVAPACHGRRNEVASSMSWHGSATHFMPLPAPPKTGGK